MVCYRREAFTSTLYVASSLDISFVFVYVRVSSCAMFSVPQYASYGEGE